jgi:hypothetical protein
MTQIKIYNTGSEFAAKAKINKIAPIVKNNFHNFTFIVCPAYGSFDLYVCSEYDFEEEDKEKALLEAFNFALMGAF